MLQAVHTTMICCPKLEFLLKNTKHLVLLKVLSNAMICSYPSSNLLLKSSKRLDRVQYVPVSPFKSSLLVLHVPVISKALPYHQILSDLYA
jgi:hypothetical protein